MRRALSLGTELLIALASLCLLLAVYFFWLLLPVAGILLYVLAQYAFRRRHRRLHGRHLHLRHEAEARAADIRRGSGRA